MPRLRPRKLIGSRRPGSIFYAWSSLRRELASASSARRSSRSLWDGPQSVEASVGAVTSLSETFFADTHRKLILSSQPCPPHRDRLIVLGIENCRAGAPPAVVGERMEGRCIGDG